MDSSSEHGKTSLQELQQWSDEEILTFVQHAKRDGEDDRLIEHDSGIRANCSSQAKGPTTHVTRLAATKTVKEQ